MAKSKKDTKKKLGALIVRATAEKAAALARRNSHAEELLALIARRKQRMLEDFYDVGEALRELAEQKLYEGLGFRSFDAMLVAHDVMSSSSAFRLITLVKQVPRAQAVSLGQEKAYALVAYTAATPEADTAADLARSNAKIGGKPVSDASGRHITATAKALRAKQAAAKPKSASQKAAAKTASDARACVLAHLRKAGIARPDVEATADRVVVRLTFAQATSLAKKR